MCSSPNGLGLNAGFLDYLRIAHGLDFWAVSDSPETKIAGLFSDSSKMNRETKFQTVHAYYSVCIAKINNMIVV